MSVNGKKVKLSDATQKELKVPLSEDGRRLVAFAGCNSERIESRPRRGTTTLGLYADATQKELKVS
jgi:hypothetical protein